MRRDEFRLAQRLTATATANFPELTVTGGSAGTILFGRVTVISSEDRSQGSKRRRRGR